MENQWKSKTKQSDDYGLEIDNEGVKRKGFKGRDEVEKGKKRLQFAKAFW